MRGKIKDWCQTHTGNTERDTEILTIVLISFSQSRFDDEEGICLLNKVHQSFLFFFSKENPGTPMSLTDMGGWEND